MIYDNNKTTKCYRFTSYKNITIIIMSCTANKFNPDSVEYSLLLNAHIIEAGWTIIFYEVSFCIHSFHY